MNRSESKYFSTAACMDEALLALLEKKDFAYITVKEVCQKAGVNRSTFYLHYESMADLLAESVEYLKKQFLAYFAPNSMNILQRIHDCPLNELFLITPEYLAPYLRYIQEHRRLFQTAVETLLPCSWKIFTNVCFSMCSRPSCSATAYRSRTIRI